MVLRRSAQIGLLLMVSLFVSALQLAAQTVGGRLLDADSGEPIASGSILLVAANGDTLRSALSGAEGAFAVGAPGAGDYRLIGVRIGYRTSPPVAVTLGATHQTVDIRLEALPIIVEGVEVRVGVERRPGELGGFYERQQRMASGRFVTRQEFERFPSSQLSDIVSALGVRIRYAPVGGGMTFYTGQGCLNLVIDGVRISERMGSHPDELVTARDIEAVEIYRSHSQVPGQFVGAFNQCGAILVWTRYSR